MAGTAEEFYDDISKRYTDSVRRCVPRYDEMLDTLFACLPRDFSPKSILELGCGTGNLTGMICGHFPKAQLQAVDISEACIKECRRRVPVSGVRYLKSDFRAIDFPDSSFDLVISSIAFHHLKDDEKRDLFKNIFRWQTTGGILTFCDQFRGETDSLYNRHMEAWRAFAFGRGITDEEWDMWMEHQSQHDYHATLSKHTEWLSDAGYRDVDCTWRYLLWAVMYAGKS